MWYTLIRRQKLGHHSCAGNPAPLINLVGKSVQLLNILKASSSTEYVQGLNLSPLHYARRTVLTSNSFYKAENVSQALYG